MIWFLQDAHQLDGTEQFLTPFGALGHCGLNGVVIVIVEAIVGKNQHLL